MIITRQIEPKLTELAQQFPVVTITGPRQSGKTTLCKKAFPNHEYLNLESPQTRRTASDDPVGFFRSHSGPLILDEIQRVPELLSYIQVLVDEDRAKGKYILTGSQQPKLAEGISQSLAGRTALLTLLPCSLGELESASVTLERNEAIHKGLMPGIHFDGIDAEHFYHAYYQTYVERDVKMLINVSRQGQFETFLRLLAGRVGQVLNLQSLAGDVGVSSVTLKEWLSVLEASFIVFRLPQFFNSFGKRVTKSPKLYFYEVGLVTWLLGIENPAHVERDPLIGGLFENMVIVEALKSRYNRAMQPNLYFFRDQRGLEVDLLALHGQSLLPMEIKSAMTYDKSFAKNLLTFCKMSNAAHSPTVIYGGEQNATTSGVAHIGFRVVAKTLEDWDSRLSSTNS